MEKSSDFKAAKAGRLPQKKMELWTILLISLTFGFFFILGITLHIKSRRTMPNIPSESIIPERVIVQVENPYPFDSIKEYLTDSSLDEDVPLNKVAQSLSLKRNKSIKYKDNSNIKKSRNLQNLPDQYRPLDHLMAGRRFNTLPTPPSTPLWVKKPVSFIKSGSISSIESIQGPFESLEERFSHSVETIPMFVKSDQQLDRATAVAFLKAKSEQRLVGKNYSTPPRGRKLERIPTNEI